MSLIIYYDKYFMEITLYVKTPHEDVIHVEHNSYSLN